MALEKQSKEGSGMPAKQKAMIVAVVVIFLVIIWQVVGLMGFGHDSAPAPVPTKAVTHQNAKTPEMTPPNANVSTASNTPPVQQGELKQAPVANDQRFMQMQQVNEQKYLDKISDLEDLKLQRAIAETNQAIATAKLATVTAEKNISDLLTKPVAPEVPAGTYANKLANPAMQGENAAAGAVPTMPVAPQVAYTVISVSMQLGKWSAVIGSQGKLFNVVVGDVLDPDSSVVVSINKSGVILRKNGVTRKVSIMTAI